MTKTTKTNTKALKAGTDCTGCVPHVGVRRAYEIRCVDVKAGQVRSTISIGKDTVYEGGLVQLHFLTGSS